MVTGMPGLAMPIGNVTRPPAFKAESMVSISCRKSISTRYSVPSLIFIPLYEIAIFLHLLTINCNVWHYITPGSGTGWKQNVSPYFALPIGAEFLPGKVS